MARLDALYGPKDGGSRDSPDPNRQHRSLIVARALADHLERSEGELQRVVCEEERRAALRVLRHELNLALDANRDALRTLHALSESFERTKRSLRRSMRNLPTADRLRFARFIQRIEDDDAEAHDEIEGHRRVGARLEDLRERLRGATVEREPDRGRVWTRGTPA